MDKLHNCPECDASDTGGYDGCHALFDEISAQRYADFRYGAVYNLSFDTYCMQHVEPYCRSAKSYAAHLTRLCCGIEFEGNQHVYAAIPRWLNGTVPLKKPEVLTFRGSLTVVDLFEAEDGLAHQILVRQWANEVWQAYSSQHEIAREWIEAALDHKPR